MRIEAAAFILSAFLLSPIALAAELAETCFPSARKTNVDAQTIRQKALAMGWKVSKSASLSAASIVAGKVALYPKSEVEICLREVSEGLEARAQAHAVDAGTAEWHKLVAKRK